MQCQLRFLRLDPTVDYGIVPISGNDPRTTRFAVNGSLERQAGHKRRHVKRPENVLNYLSPTGGALKNLLVRIPRLYWL